MEDFPGRPDQSWYLYLINQYFLFVCSVFNVARCHSAADTLQPRGGTNLLGAWWWNQPLVSVAVTQKVHQCVDTEDWTVSQTVSRQLDYSHRSFSVHLTAPHTHIRLHSDFFSHQRRSARLQVNFLKPLGIFAKRKLAEDPALCPFEAQRKSLAKAGLWVSAQPEHED